ncbi:MAG TPA: NAD(P)(+) transhydrogenase (Re/Si-specific) subunit alpha, partial [Saprospirales bacterium]|nr:NAD(P)(+) transhydrogenase (Re/Si-specific) subunit alpha [Saprospirales bacterium]
QDASSMFSTNIYNFLKYISKDGQVNMNMEDEIIGGSFITK